MTPSCPNTHIWRAGEKRLCSDCPCEICGGTQEVLPEGAVTGQPCPNCYDPDEYRAMLRGEITSKEYARRLKERVRAQRRHK